MNAPALSRPLLATNCDRRADTTGSMADYRALAGALERWHRRSSPGNLAALDAAALRCGMPPSVIAYGSVAAWSERRLTSYRTLMADASVPTAAKVLSAMVRVRLAGGSL